MGDGKGLTGTTLLLLAVVLLFVLKPDLLDSVLGTSTKKRAPVPPYSASSPPGPGPAPADPPSWPNDGHASPPPPGPPPDSWPTCPPGQLWNPNVQSCIVAGKWLPVPTPVVTVRTGPEIAAVKATVARGSMFLPGEPPVTKRSAITGGLMGF